MLRHRSVVAALAALTVGCGRIAFDDVPVAEATLDVDFTRGALGTATFARTTPGTYHDATGVLRLAAPGEPRFDHDPLTGAPRGLLIESRTINLSRHSSELDHPFDWFTNANTTFSADLALAPDGTMTADEVMDADTVIETRRAQSTTGLDQDRPYAYSIHARAGTSRTFSFAAELLEGSTPIQVGMTVDLVAGAILAPPDETRTTAYGIERLAGGWHRLWIVLTNNDSGNYRAILSVWGDLENVANTGTVFVWGAQLEQAPHPSSYIPTEVTAVTRAADEASILDVDWLDGDHGTLRVTASVEPDRSTVRPAACLLPADPSKQLCLQRSVAGLRELRLGTQTLAGSRWPERSRTTLAATWDPAGSALWDDATGGVSRLSPAPTGVRELLLGADSAQFLDGHIERVMVWPRRLSDDELQRLDP